MVLNDLKKNAGNQDRALPWKEHWPFVPEMPLQNGFWVSPWNSSWFICLCKLLALRNWGFSFAFFSPMNPTLYWTHSHSISIKPTTHKANLSGKSRILSKIHYHWRLFSVKRLEMWVLRLEPQYFPTFSLFRNSVTFVLATAMLFGCTVFKTIFYGTRMSFTFWFSQQVCGLTLRGSMWCSLRSLGLYGKWRQL